MTEKDLLAFEQASAVTSVNIRRILRAMPQEKKNAITEIRLRANRPLVVCGTFGSAYVHDENGIYRVSYAELSDTFNRLCGYSLHTHQQSICNGFITINGGHRAGISGTAVLDENGKMTGLRDIGCINIRLARQVFGAADELIERALDNPVSSLILAGPPQSGKTTILRELARNLSTVGQGGQKVAILDEREELCAVNQGICCFDVGDNTDVLDGYPKETAIFQAIRTMSPDIIVMDEISREQEVCAVEAGVNTGVRFMVSMHAQSLSDLLHKPILERLLLSGAFNKVVLLDSGRNPGKIKEIYQAEELMDEIDRNRFGMRLPEPFGLLCNRFDEKTGGCA